MSEYPQLGPQWKRLQVSATEHSRHPRHKRERSLILSYEFTFHGPAGSGGRYQPCLTEEHGWFFDGAPFTNASFEGIGSGGSESGRSACLEQQLLRRWLQSGHDARVRCGRDAEGATHVGRIGGCEGARW